MHAKSKHIGNVENDKWGTRWCVCGRYSSCIFDSLCGNRWYVYRMSYLLVESCYRTQCCQNLKDTILRVTEPSWCIMRRSSALQIWWCRALGCNIHYIWSSCLYLDVARCALSESSAEAGLWWDDNPLNPGWLSRFESAEEKPHNCYDQFGNNN